MRPEAFTHRTAYTKMSWEPSVPPPLWVAPGNLWEMYPRGLCRTVLVSRQETRSHLQEWNQIPAAWEGWGLSASKTRVCRTKRQSRVAILSEHDTDMLGRSVYLSGAQQELSVSEVHVKTSLPLHSESQVPDALTLQVQQEGEGGREVPITSAPSCWQHRPGTCCPRTPKAAELPSACSRQKSQRASMGERWL